MRISEYLKKKKIFFIITAIIVLGIILSSIYVCIIKNKESSKVVDQDLKITYNIAKELSQPMSLEDGELFANTSTIDITNNNKNEVKYKLKVKELEGNTLSLDKVYIKVDATSYILSEVKDKIYEGTIEGNSTQTLSFRTWVGENLITEEDSDKELKINYEIVEE